MALGPRDVFSSPPPGAPPRRPWPVFSGAVIAACVIVFFVDARAILSGNPGELYGSLFERLALFGPMFAEGDYWRPLSYALVHGSPMHLFFNMSAIASLGTFLERAFGWWRLALISLATCLGAAAFILFFDFAQITVGISGVAFGLLGVLLPISTGAGRRMLFPTLLLNALISLVPGVSWAGHLGGFLFGLPLGFALRLGKGWFLRIAPAVLAVSIGLTALAAVLAPRE